ncbi:ABC transporter ATP-binding protein [Clostridiales bacterium S5-A14a]|nr:ABC transporter ATP-binding protein [Clostridiales bacterium S5-A14a]
MFLEVKNLTKSYGEGDNRVKVLEDVSLDINKGEICSLLGPSGSGKSTLLNLIGGLERADGGDIIIDSLTISKLRDKELGEYRRHELGFIFQFYNLIPDLSVKENIEIGSAIVSDSMDLKELISALGLEDQCDKLPNQLSGGQQQRCAIGRALIKKPALLICDEPTGALDYKTSKEILTLICDINKKYDTTIIIATHNEAISQIAHRTIRLRDGKIHENITNDHIIAASELTW